VLSREFGPLDLQSQVYPFDMTSYYEKQAVTNILRQFVTKAELIDPGRLAGIKHATNALEEQLAKQLATDLPRPINLDPGYIEPSKLVLASTKNFSHRIYIGQDMYAEVTLSFHRGRWQGYPFTFPDFKSGRYDDFLNEARHRLVQQQKAMD
jgi:hypothetical protein